ncbi:MAG: hypothetical protein Q9197_006448, partial [Variospora fuerteventurae]
MHASPLPNRCRSDSQDDDLGEFVLIDDLFKARAHDEIQIPLVAFPQSKRGINDFELFTGQDLDRFVEHAARYYIQAGLRFHDTSRVALLGPTDIQWIVTFFGLLRAGFAVVTLSPRLSSQAVANLMSETDCAAIICADSPQILRTIDQVTGQMKVQAVPLLRRAWFDRPWIDGPPLTRDIDKAKEAERMVIIMHSSGSTGFPKPVYTNHKRYTQLSLTLPGTKDFMTLPLYHASALTLLPSTMYKRRTVFFSDANRPLTAENISKVVTAARPDQIFAVPYVLKLFSEQPESLDVLRSCAAVVTVGSHCPDALGDRLVKEGVNLCNWFGSTEVGMVGTSSHREPGDKEWAYFRIPQPRMRNIWPRYICEDQYEFVYLKDYPSRVVSNSQDPPQSFYSKDMFSPHATVPNAWKYLGRIDDRVTLTNGEKVLPLPIEGRIRKQPLVREAIVFGIAKPIPGLLAFRSEAAKDMPDDDFVERIWPDVEAANQAAEGFSQIGKGMIVPMPANAEYPQTDKGSFIRPQMYQAFQKEIGEAYNRLNDHQEGSLWPKLSDLEDYLLGVGRQLTGPQLEDKTTDFFTVGMDSLRAIRMRGTIIKDLDLGGNSKCLNQNIVFETSNVEKLARHVNDLRQGHIATTENPKTIMRAWIQKYGVFKKRAPGSKSFPGKHTVVLTGATGGLGSHLLSKLCSDCSVAKIYCLLRGRDPLLRVRRSLADRNLQLDTSKTTALTSDLSDPVLGLDEATYAKIRSSVTHIIHAAWPVNFQLPLSSFESHVQGLHNLLDLSLSTPYTTSAKLLFCSSVSTALGTPPPATIPEAIIEDLDHAVKMGYGQSKLVSEHVVAAAVADAGARACVLRIGQIVGDTKFGTWNDAEAIPSIVRSALTMGVLPELKMACGWLPVDTVADVILELGSVGAAVVTAQREEQHLLPDGDSGTDRRSNGTEVNSGNTQANTIPVNGALKEEKEEEEDEEENPMRLVYNITSPRRPFSWTTEFLPALRASGLEFATVPAEEWLARLRSLSSSTPTLAQEKRASDPEANPALKLLPYYELTLFRRDEEEEGM